MTDDDSYVMKGEYRTEVCAMMLLLWEGGCAVLPPTTLAPDSI